MSDQGGRWRIWVAPLDGTLPLTMWEPLFLGWHKIDHYRLWFRDQFKSIAQDKVVARLGADARYGEADDVGKPSSPSILTSNAPPVGDGHANVVSEKFISRANACMRSVGHSDAGAPTTTASWLPAYGRSANTSTMKSFGFEC